MGLLPLEEAQTLASGAEIDFERGQTGLALDHDQDRLAIAGLLAGCLPAFSAKTAKPT